MSNPTTSSFWNQTTPAVPTGDQACVIQSDGVTPQDSRTVYPKTATSTLRGVVKPDTTTVTVDGSGNLSAKPMVGDTGSGGAAGIVPAPPAGSAAAGKYLKADGTFAVPAASGSAGGDLGGSYPNPTVTATHLAAPLPVVQGGTGTATPGIVAGTNVTVSGTWPNQTVNSSAGSTIALKHDGTANGSQSILNLKGGSGVGLSDDGVGGVTISVSAASPNFAQQVAAQSTSTTISATLSSSVSSGSAIIVALFAGSFTTSISGVTDNHGNTYTLVKSIYPATTYCGQYVYIALNATGGSTTITATFTQANNQMNMLVAEYSGVAAASAVDVTASTDNGSSASDCTIGPITTTASGDILFSTFAFYHNLRSASSGFTTRGSFTGVTDTNLIGYIADAQATSAGAYSVTWTGTWGGGNSNAGILIALKGSGSVTFPVSSVFGRGGAVAAASGDYTAAQVTGAATQAAIQQESYIYGTDTGAANAYAVTLSPAPTVVAGSVVCFKAANTNTGASTLAVNGGTATAIRKNGTNVLSAGDIAVGQIIDATYDGTYWQIIVPGTGGGASISLTTTGSSGAATLTGSVLNVPVYTGGGGGGSSIYPTLTTPLTANFAFSNPNSYAATATDKTGRLLLQIPTSSLGIAYFPTTALPSTPYTVDCGFIVGQYQTNVTVAASLALKAAGGAIRSYGLRADGTGLWYLNDQSWSSVTSPGAQNNTTSVFLNPSQMLFLRITDDGTNRKIYFSSNGQDYNLWLTQATGTGVVPTSAGLIFYLASGNPSQQNLSFYHWLVSTSVLPQFAT